MGGGPSGDSSGMGVEADVKGIAKQRADRQRQAMAKTGVQDPYEFTRLRENLQAQQLEKQAEKGQINVPIPTMGSIALNTIGGLAARQQAAELRRGGEMITDDQGEYKGVVGTNFLGGRVYSGDPAFDPISRGTTSGDDSSTPVTQRADITPEVTPEITPERIENDEPITTRYARRRTKRAGQAGTILEGYGVLSRPASKRAVT
jgi:hypothetical protein